MIQDEIERTLPHGRRLPAALRALCQYADEHGYPISGCFELSTIGMEDLRGWFRLSPSAADDFLPFGRGATGDVYAVWLTNEPDPERAPVVMFGSEGLLRVLASDSAEFCTLLGVGYKELGNDDESAPPVENEAPRALREFLRKRFQVVPPHTGEEIVRVAAAAHPGFQSWVEERLP